MISCNQNENDNGKTDHINKTKIDLNADIETNIKNIAFLCNSLYVISNNSATFEAQFIKTVTNTEGELKKSVTYKKCAFHVCMHGKNKSKVRKLQKI